MELSHGRIITGSWDSSVRIWDVGTVHSASASDTRAIQIGTAIPAHMKPPVSGGTGRHKRSESTPPVTVGQEIIVTPASPQLANSNPSPVIGTPTKFMPPPPNRPPPPSPSPIPNVPNRQPPPSPSPNSRVQAIVSESFTLSATTTGTATGTSEGTTPTLKRNRSFINVLGSVFSTGSSNSLTTSSNPNSNEPNK